MLSPLQKSCIRPSVPWLPQPFQGKLPFLLHSGGKAGRFLSASCFLPGLTLCWGAVPWLPPTQGCLLVQQICSTDGLAQKDLLRDLLEPASLLVYSFKEKKVLMLSVSVRVWLLWSAYKGAWWSRHPTLTLSVESLRMKYTDHSALFLLIA